jgi:hypothetical protein
VQNLSRSSHTVFIQLIHFALEVRIFRNIFLELKDYPIQYPAPLPLLQTQMIEARNRTNIANQFKLAIMSNFKALSNSFRV